MREGKCSLGGCSLPDADAAIAARNTTATPTKLDFIFFNGLANWRIDLCSVMRQSVTIGDTSMFG